MTLGEKIARERKELNYTQEQLADILEVSRQSISKWESDITFPETDKIIRLSQIFDCSIDYLLKEELTEKQQVTPTMSGKLLGIKDRMLTENNKRKAKFALKLAGIVFGALLAVDFIAMIIYFAINGIPK